MSAATATRIVDALPALAFSYVLVSAYWPWDWLGRRRIVTLKRDRRPWQ